MASRQLTKEQQQVAILVVLGVAVVGVLLFFYGAALLPKPTGTSPVPPARPGVVVPAVNEQALYDRKDFMNLHRFGIMPVRPTGPNGNKDPFAAAAIGR